jgi:hypothetical protein
MLTIDHVLLFGRFWFDTIINNTIGHCVLADADRIIDSMIG